MKTFLKQCISGPAEAIQKGWAVSKQNERDLIKLMDSNRSNDGFYTLYISSDPKKTCRIEVKGGMVIKAYNGQEMRRNPEYNSWWHDGIKRRISKYVFSKYNVNHLIGRSLNSLRTVGYIFD
jgi:hypothetical protein